MKFRLLLIFTLIYTHVAATDLNSETYRGNQTAMEMIVKITGGISFDPIPEDILITNSIVNNPPIDTTGNKVIYLLESKKNYGKNLILRDDFNYEYNDKGLLVKFTSKGYQVEERILYWTYVFTSLMKHYIINYQYDEKNNCTEMKSLLPTGEILNTVLKKFDSRDKVIEYKYKWEHKYSGGAAWAGHTSQKTIQLGYNESGLIDYVNDGKYKYIYKYDQYSNIISRYIYNLVDYSNILVRFINKISRHPENLIGRKEIPIKKDKSGRIISYSNSSILKSYVRNIDFSYENEGNTVVANYYSKPLETATFYRDIIEKDENGRIIRKEFINVSNPISGTNREDFKYDENGHKIQYTYSNGGGTSADNISWHVISKENQIYDQEKLKRIESYARDTNSGNYLLNSSTDYSYDSNGFLSEIVFSKIRNSVFEDYEKRVFKNDENGNVLSDYQYTKVAGEYTFMSGFDCTYKAFQYQKPAENVTEVCLIPNPAISYIEILSLPEPVTLNLYNSAGYMVKKCRVSPNERISVQDLPKGIYFYSFISAGKSFKGKIIKSNY